jgi:6-phosphogluconolactonase
LRPAAPELRVFADHEAASRAAAEELARAARAGGHVALSGGGTPRHAYELAAELEPDWSGATVWFGDDRAVPPDDERSNYRLAKESLLDRLARAPAAVNRIRGELGAAAAADDYELLVRGRALDLALQGLGPDGHTASLFPGKPALDERERAVVATEPGLEPWVDRVTMTVPALCAARLVLYLVTGAEKAEPATRAFGGAPDPGTPASLVRSTAGRTIVMLDHAAASLLGDSLPLDTA